MEWTSQLEVIVSTAAAMLLGGLIGLERELKNRPAGFRTHMLVAAAASLLMVAVIGTAAGFQYYVLAFAATALTLLVLTVLNAVELWLKSRRPPAGDDP